MSIESRNDQEIDLGTIFNKFSGIFKSFIDLIFDFLYFLKRNSILITLLFILGIVSGVFLDRNIKNYRNELIITPNFESVDYLYTKIELLNAKIKESDTIFFSKLGFKNIKKVSKIDIEPIIDVYDFISKKPEHFEMIKLLADNGDIDKVIENGITSKNYPKHFLNIFSKSKISREDFVDPLFKYLNDSEYFKNRQAQAIENIHLKVQANDTVLKQIDNLISKFSHVQNNKADLRLYNNENNQINDIITTKNNLVSEQGNLKMNLLTNDSIIKEVNTTLNILQTKGVNSKLKIVLPFIFVGIFIILRLLINFYKRELNKRIKN